MKRLRRSVRPLNSVSRLSIDLRLSCWSSMKTTDRDRRKWAHLTSPFKIKNRPSNAESAGWNVSSRSQNRPPTRRRILTSWRCRRTSLLKNFGLLSSKPKWKKKWSRTSSTKTRFKRSALPLDIQMFKKLYRSSWPVNRPIPSCSHLWVSRKRRSTLSETTTSSGGRSFTSFKFLSRRQMLRPTVPAVPLPLNWTLLIRK